MKCPPYILSGLALATCFVIALLLAACAANGAYLPQKVDFPVPIKPAYIDSEHDVLCYALSGSEVAMSCVYVGARK